MIEHEAFYATAAQVIPVLLLATVWEHSMSRTAERVTARKQKQLAADIQQRSNLDADLLVELDGYLSGLRREIGQKWRHRLEKVMVLFAQVLPPLLSLVSVGISVIVLTGSLGDSAVLRGVVAVAIALQLGILAATLTIHQFSIYRDFVNWQQRAHEAIATGEDLRKVLIARLTTGAVEGEGS